MRKGCVQGEDAALAQTVDDVWVDHMADNHLVVFAVCCVLYLVVVVFFIYCCYY